MTILLSSLSMVSVGLAGMVLFGVGVFKGQLAGQFWGRSGLEFLAIALAASAIGYGIGFVLERMVGTHLPAGLLF